VTRPCTARGEGEHRDKYSTQSKINTATAALEALKAKAEAATASADLAAIRHVLTRQPVIDEKLIELKRTSETKY
jgi:hypothetical protein